MRVYNTKTGKFETVHGSDNREDVSARMADRFFYISRNKGSMYSWPVTYTAAKDDFVYYFKNNSSTEKFYVKDIYLESDTDCDFELCWVTGTAGGEPITAVKWNRSVPHTLLATALNSGVSDIADDGHILGFDVKAGVTSVANFGGALILGKDDAIAISVNAASRVHITLIGAFE